MKFTNLVRVYFDFTFFGYLGREQEIIVSLGTHPNLGLH
jgi:hypothetical protein